MKRLTFLAGTAALIFGGSAIAFGASHTVTLSATVPGICSLSAAATDPSGPFKNVTDTGSTFAVGVNPASGVVSETSGILSFGQATCNGSSKLTLSRVNGKLKGPNTTSGLPNSINYTAQAQWNGLSPVELNSSSDLSKDMNIPGGAGSIDLTITVPETQQPLLAGQYSDTLTVTLAANN
jgi:hypothetical protein